MSPFPQRSIKERLLEEQLNDYLKEHSSKESSHLQDIRSRANEQLVYPRMVSGHLQGLLLKMLVQMIRPQKVLELGTFAGYATVCIAEALPEGGMVTTIEVEEELFPFIETSLRHAGVRDRVSLLGGDALSLLEQIPLEEYQLIYLDSNKRSYPQYFHAIVEKMSVGCFLVADNTLWGGKVWSDTVKDPQTKGIQEFNELVAKDDRLFKLLLPFRDGITLIQKRQN